MSELSAYKGDLPYIFVSYAHRDSEQVFPLLAALQDAGFRIWFDHGIEAGTEWSNNIAEHLSGCSAFLFFASQNSVKSENCLDEVAYAKSHNKPALLAYLEEDVVLPSGTDMQTARFQRMYINRQPDMETFVKNFAEAAIFDICRGDAVAAPKGAIPVKPEKPAKTEKKSLPLGLIIGIAAAVIAVVLAVVLLPGLGGEDAPAGDDNTITETTPSQPEIVELSDSLSDHTLQLGGVVYKLPISYAQLTANGWTISSGSTSETYLSGKAEVGVNFVKDGKKIYAHVYNDGEHAKQLKDCHIGAIEVEQGNAGDFCIAAGMKPGDEVETFIEKLGTPTERSEGSNYVLMTWKLGDLAQVKVRCYTEDMAKYSTILIANYVMSTQTFEPKQEAPAFLDTYVAPESLGDDLISGRLSVEGVVYELPAPLREFLNNGWEIASGASSLMSGASADMTLKKGECKLSIIVTNPSLYKTIPENCVVVKVAAEAKNNVQLQLPGGIALGMTAKEVEALLPSSLTVYEGTYSTTYSHSDYNDRDFRLNLSVSKDQRQLTDIYVANYISVLLAG